MPRKSDLWVKTVYRRGTADTTETVPTIDMVSDLSYSKTIDLEGRPIKAMWLQAVDEPDLKMIVLRDADNPLVITYRRKEDE